MLGRGGPAAGVAASAPSPADWERTVRPVAADPAAGAERAELANGLGADLLISLFSPYSPLHDGAVVVEGDTIIAAGVILPLTQFPVADKSLGTRHRAALGLSEETDALVIVVSEETSQISLANRGRLERNIDLDRLKLALTTGVVQPPVPA